MVGAAGDAAVGLAGLGAFKYFAGGMCLFYVFVHPPIMIKLR